ncbi:MAG TPA: protein phosphatase 2C domain-containing protein [Candidatus Sulfotelmatobacter sp.]|nr:protein phosphatase 2C domain-containing protein [Candidatus Sulfotelmatobacter sp.]
MDNSRHREAPKGLQWSGRTDRGRVRPNNEDAFTGLQFDAREVHHLGAMGEGPTGQMDFAFAVSDGMGGAKAGEHASEVAVQKLTSLLPRLYRRSAAQREAGFAPVLEDLFAEVHRALAYLGGSYEECHGMEATLSLCWFSGGRMHFGHIGDSRIYHLPARTAEVTQLTHDDTHVGWLLRNGKINEREARTHPRRNLLQKALGGSNQFVTPQVGSVVYEPGDIFLLCTDGLVKGLYDHQLRELLCPSAPDHLKGASPAHRLVEESLARDGRDNTTALAIRVL